MIVFIKGHFTGLHHSLWKIIFIYLTIILADYLRCFALLYLVKITRIVVVSMKIVRIMGDGNSGMTFVPFIITVFVLCV